MRAFYDALARLSRLESASTASFEAPSLNTGTATGEGNITSKKEFMNVTNFGTMNGLAYQEWVSDVKTSTEQVDELMVFVIGWIDGQNTLEDVADAEFHRWANGSSHNQLDLERSLKQLYNFMNAKRVPSGR